MMEQLITRMYGVSQSGVLNRARIKLTSTEFMAINSKNWILIKSRGAFHIFAHMLAYIYMQRYIHSAHIHTTTSRTGLTIVRARDRESVLILSAPREQRLLVKFSRN